MLTQNASLSPLTICLAALLAAYPLQAQILSAALLGFPDKTESIEYDNLYELHKLPAYPALRQRFSGKPLDQAKDALAQLGIDEMQVNEMVVGTSPGQFYGLLSGTFSASSAVSKAQKNGIAPLLIDSDRLYCPKGPVCVVFLEDSLAAFSTYDQLKVLLETRLGSLPRLNPKGVLASLIRDTPPRSPVRGAVFGSELNSVLSDALQDESGLNLDWTKLTTNISAFSYAVDMDSRAHVVAKVVCQSAATAAVLHQALDALRGVQQAARKIGQDPASMPFQNLQVSASESVLDLTMDTRLPPL
jgi:hypothetical protein